jgi:hypothetical protein
LLPIWIEGASRTGKTTRLVERFSLWLDTQTNDFQGDHALVLVANNYNRRSLRDFLSRESGGKYAVNCQTCLGFFEDEVILFWPLLCEQLGIKSRFPMVLRPETEQELATKLWKSQLERAILPGVTEDRLVRNILDLLQLAGAAGVKLDQVPVTLRQGLYIFQLLPELDAGAICAEWFKMLKRWYFWCLSHGFLSYGLIYYLYGRFLFPHGQYQDYLRGKYGAVFADDLDDYPAIASHIFDFFLDQNKFAVFTYNPQGQVRLGLNADPDYLRNLSNRCQKQELKRENSRIETVIQLLTNFDYNESLPPSMLQIKAITRASLLQKVCQFITTSVGQGEIAAEEIAIIAPGLDAIARYGLIEMLSAHNIPIEPINEQFPLVNYAHIRALLTLLSLTYKGLAPIDAVMEMLTVLSQKPNLNRKLEPEIDFLRAGLLVDHCYQSETGNFVDYETNFPRWDRLGYRASIAYNHISQWLRDTKILVQGQQITPLEVLDKAIKDFYSHGIYFNSANLAILREFMETAEHYWEVNQRIGEHQNLVSKFIELLQQGTITANPRPVGILGQQKKAIALATIYQYRQQRSSHRWHFWLDTNSRLWEKGGSVNLFGSSLFLHNWDGQLLTLQKEEQMNRDRLMRIIKDLIARNTDKIYLCASDLDINGNEQIATLSTLNYAAQEL